MNEKLKNKICEAAMITMAGDLLVGACEEEEGDARLSCSLEDLLSGRIQVLFGHPESFDSKMGQHILRELHKHEMLILVRIDEFHQAGKGHWMSFRPSMMSSSSGLRLVLGNFECFSLRYNEEIIETHYKHGPFVVLSSCQLTYLKTI